MRDLEDALLWGKRKAEELTRIQGTPHAERKYATVGEVIDAYCDRKNHRRWKQGRTPEKATELAKKLGTSALRARRCHDLDEDSLQTELDSVRRADPDDDRPLATSYLQDMRAFFVGLAKFGVKNGYFEPGQLNIELELPEALEDLVDADDGDPDGAGFGVDVEHGEDDENRPGFRVWRRHLPSWTFIRALADAMANPVHWLLVMLAATSGLRFGELAALRWTDIDCSRRIIHVRRKVAESNRGKQWIELPKNRKKRDACYPAWLATHVATRVASARQAERDALAAAQDPGALDPNKLGLLFPAPRGGWLRRSNFNGREWRTAWTAAGWRKPWSFHTLRHCAAIYMIYELEMDLVDVAEVLGHANVSVTQRIYCQARDGAADRVAAGMAGADAPWSAGSPNAN